MITWNPLYGTGVRRLQGMARAHGLGLFEEFADIADTAAGLDVADVVDWGAVDWGALSSLDMSDLPAIDASSYEISPYDELSPYDASSFDPNSAVYDGASYDELAAPAELPADVGPITQTFDDGSTLTVDGAGNPISSTPAPSIALPAASSPINIADAAKAASGPASSILKTLLSAAPAAIQVATSLMKSQAQIDAAKASLQRGQIPAGYAVNSKGQLVASGSTLDAIAHHIAANKTLYIIGGVTIAAVLVAKRGRRTRKGK